MPDPRARDLRQNPTDAERKLWAHLRLRQVHGHKFRRQRPIGPYIVDFVCLEERLVIEVDGSQHLERALISSPLGLVMARPMNPYSMPVGMITLNLSGSGCFGSGTTKC